MGRHALNLFPIFQMAGEGLTQLEMASSLGCSMATLRKFISEHGLEVPRGRETPRDGAVVIREATSERDRKIISMHNQGLTLHAIGLQFGFSREYIRQILAGYGLRSTNSAKKARRKRAEIERQARKDAASFARFGVPDSVRLENIANGLIPAFRSQRNNAKSRAVYWGLKFSDWLSIWEASGKLPQRGSRKDQFVMSRIKDAGGYVLGNVHIQTTQENGREAIENCGGRKKKHTGVFFLFPGLSRPWVAKYGKIFIASCATEEEAATARSEFLKTYKKPPRRKPNDEHSKGPTSKRRGHTKSTSRHSQPTPNDRAKLLQRQPDGTLSA